MLFDVLIQLAMQLVESRAGSVLLGVLGALVVVLAVSSRSTSYRRPAVVGWAVLLVAPAMVWLASCLVRARSVENAAVGFFFLWSLFGAPTLAVNGTLRGLWPVERVGYRVTLQDAVIVFHATSFLRIVALAAHV